MQCNTDLKEDLGAVSRLHPAASSSTSAAYIQSPTPRLPSLPKNTVTANAISNGTSANPWVFKFPQGLLRIGTYNAGPMVQICSGNLPWCNILNLPFFCTYKSTVQICTIDWPQCNSMSQVTTSKVNFHFYA